MRDLGVIDNELRLKDVQLITKMIEIASKATKHQKDKVAEYELVFYSHVFSKRNVVIVTHVLGVFSCFRSFSPLKVFKIIQLISTNTLFTSSYTIYYFIVLQIVMQKVLLRLEEGKQIRTCEWDNKEVCVLHQVL